MSSSSPSKKPRYADREYHDLVHAFGPHDDSLELEEVAVLAVAIRFRNRGLVAAKKAVHFGYERIKNHRQVDQVIWYVRRMLVEIGAPDDLLDLLGALQKLLVRRDLMMRGMLMANQPTAETFSMVLVRLTTEPVMIEVHEFPRLHQPEIDQIQAEIKEAAEKALMAWRVFMQ